ncbi:hypothetical protein ACIGO8_12105 [Streptomyces sp. NPDC053493]
MSGQLTDRDERMWQRRTEERMAAPWEPAHLLRALRAWRRRAPRRGAAA